MRNRLRDVPVLIRRLTQRGRYSLGIAVDKRWCSRHQLTLGDEVEMFEHPTKPEILCLRVRKRRQKSG